MPAALVAVVAPLVSRSFAGLLGFREELIDAERIKLLLPLELDGPGAGRAARPVSALETLVGREPAGEEGGRGQSDTLVVLNIEVMAHVKQKTGQKVSLAESRY